MFRIGFILVAAVLVAMPAEAVTLERERYLMGSPLTLTLVGPDEAALQAAANAAFDEVDRLEQRLSNWRTNSELSRLNAAAGQGAVPVSAELHAVIERALEWARRTEGAYDPTVEALTRAYDLRGEGRWPSDAERSAARAQVGWDKVKIRPGWVELPAGVGIDLGGIGKGYALDRAAAVLRERGVTNALLNFGGQVLALGDEPGQNGWRVPLADPADRARAALEPVLRNASLAVSGQAERALDTGRGPLGHVLDPRTGQPATTLGSAAAVAADATDADALSTALLVLGPEAGLALIEKLGDVAAYYLAPGSVRRGGAHPGLFDAATPSRTPTQLRPHESTRATGAEPLAQAQQPPPASPPPSAAPAQTPTTPGSAETPSNEELARRIEILAAELEELKLGRAAEPAESRHGLAPGASRVYAAPSGVSLAGYGEVLYEHFGRRDESGRQVNQKATVDFLRLITYFGYKFDDRVLFNSEIEYEHASTGKGGEVSVEFGYLDFLLEPEINARVGLLLVPMGWINELHEPPVFLGTHRPDIERTLIPSTWRANGLGIFGDLGDGLSYRAYLVEGLRATRFSASDGLRGGRQSGSKAIAEQWAGVARVDWESQVGVLLGASAYSGGSSQGEFREIVRTTVAEVHGQYRAHGLWLRGLAAGVDVADASVVNSVRPPGFSVVGSRMFGWYAEAAYDLWKLWAPESDLSLLPYARFERFDTQHEVPAGYARDPQNDRRTLTLGAAFYPHPQVALKADWQNRRNQAESGVDVVGVSASYLY